MYQIILTFDNYCILLSILCSLPLLQTNTTLCFLALFFSSFIILSTAVVCNVSAVGDDDDYKNKINNYRFFKLDKQSEWSYVTFIYSVKNAIKKTFECKYLQIV
jgi:hypothetical protein